MHDSFAFAMALCWRRRTENQCSYVFNCNERFRSLIESHFHLLKSSELHNAFVHVTVAESEENSCSALHDARQLKECKRRTELDTNEFRDCFRDHIFGDRETRNPPKNGAQSIYPFFSVGAFFLVFHSFRFSGAIVLESQRPPQYYAA